MIVSWPTRNAFTIKICFATLRLRNADLMAEPERVFFLIFT